MTWCFLLHECLVDPFRSRTYSPLPHTKHLREGDLLRPIVIVREFLDHGA